MLARSSSSLGRKLPQHWFITPAAARHSSTTEWTTPPRKQPFTIPPLRQQVVGHDRTPTHLFAPMDKPDMAMDKPDVASFSWSKLISAKEMLRSDIEHAIDVASRIGVESRAAGPWRRLGPPRELNILKGRMLANLFFEPSTRTSSSFATAMTRMGGSYLNLNVATSSASKGETLSDTVPRPRTRPPRTCARPRRRDAPTRGFNARQVRVMSEYADVIAMRHPSATVFEDELGGGLLDEIPILNAGNGTEEHPTQALLDLLCMKTELGVASLDGLTVTLVGDLKHGRTVHSLATMLAKFEGVTLNLVAPSQLRMPEKWMATIAETGTRVNHVDVRPHSVELERNDHMAFVDKSDVIYVTRVQQERFDSQEAYDAVKKCFVLNANDLAGSKAIVMHPLPRVNEVHPSVDALPNAKYFEQVGYGCVMRSALLGLALGADL